MPGEELTKLVRRISRLIADALRDCEPPQRNELWTKLWFIWPMLQGLGWDELGDILVEDRSQGEGSLDFVIASQPSIGIEAKALDVVPPADRSHQFVQKGLKQARDREASYFVWTNGDCWQFFSLALPQAPMYSVRISDAQHGPEQTAAITRRLSIIDKEAFSASPGLFDEAIRANWRAEALPAARDALLEEQKHAFLELVGQSLPDELSIEDEEILTFFRSLEPPDAPEQAPPVTLKRRQEGLSFPEDWEKLMDSREPPYPHIRDRLSDPRVRKLAEYMTSDGYEEWPKKTSWIYAGVPNIVGRKLALSNVMRLLKDWSFIEETETGEHYRRVEEGVPYLKQLLGLE